MILTDSLEDVTIRERQLETHLLRSPEYLRRADRELKRQVSMLYLAIALLIVFQGLFTWQASSHIPFAAVIMTSVTSILAIFNCLLLIRTKTFLRRLNDSWLKPEEKIAVQALRNQRNEILTRNSGFFSGDQRAELN